MIDISPEAVITVSPLGNETMDVGIPFQVPAKGMKNHDKAGSEVHGLVLFVKHAGNNTVHGMEEAVKEFAVVEEKFAEVFIDGEHAMPVGNIDKFK